MKPSRVRAKTPGRIQPGRRVNSNEALLQPVEVYCRVKPLDEAEERCVRVIGEKVIEITPPDGSLAMKAQTQNAKATQYTFTRVFDEQTDQKEIFDVVARPLVSDLIRGKNGLLFAYGNTGSGKTYTMTGDSQNGGIMPRSVDVLFNTVSSLLAPKHVFKPDKLNGFDVQASVDAMADASREYLSGAAPGAQTRMDPRTPGRTRGDLIDSSGRVQDTSIVSGVDSDVLYGVFITYAEIYNNNVYDLLEVSGADSNKAKTQFQSKILREDSTRRMFVHGVNEVEVRSADDAIELFRRGQKRRRVAQTTLNAESSRSHSIFTIRLVQAPVNAEGTEAIQDKNYLTISQLSLVDLAGCERSSRTNTKGDRLKEAGNINNTLMTLRSCIETLRENQQTGASKIVPYRDSKITHIFKSYFEGEGRIKMVVCVNPRAEDFDETILVMRFAEMTQEVAVQTQTTRPTRYDNGFTPGRRRANALYQDAMNRLNDEAYKENVPVDMDAIFSLGTFPAHELNDDETDEEVISNLMDFLRHRSQTRLSLVDQQHARKMAFRARLAVADTELQQLRYENESLKGRLDAEIAKTRKLETDIINLRHSSETKSRRAADMEKRLASKEQEFAEIEHQLKQAQAESERIKAKYTTKLLDQKERIQRRVDQKMSEETEQLKNKILARERQLKQIGVMALRDKYQQKTTPLPSANSDTDLQIATSRIRTESETRQSRRDRAQAGAEPLRHRRSRSTGTADKWLDHRPPSVAVPLGTVLQPRLPNRRSVTKLTDVKDVGNFDKYVLTTQENDSAGELETKLYKGNVFPTSGGGAQVVLDDVEILKQTSPTRVRKRDHVDPHLPHEIIEARCRAGAVEGHGNKKLKR